MAFYVDRLASKRNGTLYLGRTEDLINRVREHKDHVRSGLTSKYGVTPLVWCEIFDTRDEAFCVSAG